MTHARLTSLIERACTLIDERLGNRLPCRLNLLCGRFPWFDEWFWREDNE